MDGGRNTTSQRSVDGGGITCDHHLEALWRELDALAAEPIAATLDEFAGLMSRARGTDLNRANAHVPSTRPIRFDLGDALEIQVAHVARHPEQAHRFREDPAFPRRAA